LLNHKITSLLFSSFTNIQVRKNL